MDVKTNFESILYKKDSRHTIIMKIIFAIYVHLKFVMEDDFSMDQALNSMDRAFLVSLINLLKLHKFS